MNRTDLLAFLRAHALAVEATVSPSGSPQAALVAFAVTDDLELVFDTRHGARKAENVRREPRVAFVVGWSDGQTVQVEGLADEPTGADLARLKAVYFAARPDAPELHGKTGMTYVRVRPAWVRYCDVRGGAPRVVELGEAELRG